jgi:hypothetical protein
MNHKKLLPLRKERSPGKIDHNKNNFKAQAFSGYQSTRCLAIFVKI